MQIFGWTEPTPEDGYAKYLMLFRDGFGNVSFRVRDRHGVISEVAIPPLQVAFVIKSLVAPDPEEEEGRGALVQLDDYARNRCSVDELP